MLFRLCLTQYTAQQLSFSLAVCFETSLLLSCIWIGAKSKSPFLLLPHLHLANTKPPLADGDRLKSQTSQVEGGEGKQSCFIFVIRSLSPSVTKLSGLTGSIFLLPFPTLSERF